MPAMRSPRVRSRPHCDERTPHIVRTRRVRAPGSVADYWNKQELEAI